MGLSQLADEQARDGYCVGRVEHGDTEGDDVVESDGAADIDQGGEDSEDERDNKAVEGDGITGKSGDLSISLTKCFLARLV